MNYLVSIIVPIYNTGKRLRRAIESVVKQTYSNLELILVDDGSTDLLTINILSEYENNHFYDDLVKIKVIHQINKGVAAARNEGMRNALGDYIMFLDADDYYSSDAVEKNMTLVSAGANSLPVDIIMRDMNIFYENSGMVSTSAFFIDQRVYKGKIEIDDLIADIFSTGFFSNIAGGCYRTEFVRQCNYCVREDVLLCEDIDWNLRLMLMAECIATAHDSIYTYCRYDRVVTPGIDRYRSQIIVSEEWVNNSLLCSRKKKTEKAIINRFSDTFVVFSIQCSMMNSNKREIAVELCRKHLNIAKQASSIKSKLFYYMAYMFGVNRTIAILGRIYHLKKKDTINLA